MSTALTPITFNITIQHESEFPVQLKELHAELLSRRHFWDWTKMKLSQFVEGEDFIILTQNCVKPQRGRPALDYAVTLDTAKEIAMMENTGRGRDVRRYFIAVEKAYRAQAAAPQDLALVLAEIRKGFAELRAENAELRLRVADLEDDSFLPAPLRLPLPKQRPVDREEAAAAIVTEITQGHDDTFNVPFDQLANRAAALRLTIEPLPVGTPSFQSSAGKLIRKLFDGYAFTAHGLQWRIRKLRTARHSAYRFEAVNVSQ